MIRFEKKKPDLFNIQFQNSINTYQMTIFHSSAIDG